jgi:hypothetical protein
MDTLSVFSGPHVPTRINICHNIGWKRVFFYPIEAKNKTIKLPEWQRAGHNRVDIA